MSFIPLQCEVCGKLVGYAGTLNRHLRFDQKFSRQDAYVAVEMAIDRISDDGDDFYDKVDWTRGKR